MKQKLVKCAPRAYSELIKSDIPGPSSARPAHILFLRSSPLSVMKPPVSKSSSPSVSKPLISKPTWGEFRVRLEVLEKKKRSVKRKPPTSPEGCPPARGKILKVGASSSPSSVVGAGDSSGDRDRFEPAGSEDSLLSHAELAVGAVSSILRDSDLRKVESLSVEEALALLLQGTASVRPSVFIDLFLYCFSSVS